MKLTANLRCSCFALLPFLTLNDLNAQTAIRQTTFRSNAQMVLVPVTVTDHNAKTITGLRAQDFSILDNGTPQQIVSFTSEDAPSSIGLILDISGSMRNALSTAKNVAHGFLGAANPEDEFMLLTVSTAPEATSRFSTDIAALEEGIEGTKSEGMTALIDTVYLGLNRMRKANQPRRALLILSDGMDNYSRYSESELMRVAQEADVQIYAIIMDNGSGGTVGGAAPFRPTLAAKPWDQARQRQGPSLLEKLADTTGGLYFHVRKATEASEAAVKAGRALRDEYVIGYQAPQTATVGKYHHVRVKALVPKVNVYTRNGYYSQ
jgi:Ca-activated chloride channel family protein